VKKKNEIITELKDIVDIDNLFSNSEISQKKETKRSKKYYGY